MVGSVGSGGGGGLCGHPSPCHNGGSCETHDGVFTCYCPPGFAGKLCQHDLTKSRYVRTIGNYIYPLSPSALHQLTFILTGLFCRHFESS